MYLNSLLFPAPKSSYTIERLKDELIWIPKYHKKIDIMSRLSSSTAVDNAKLFQLDLNSPIETPRNQVPQLLCKPRPPFSPQLELKVNGAPITESKFVRNKRSFINDEQVHHQGRKEHRLSEISDVSFQETSSMFEEKTERNANNLGDNLKQPAKNPAGQDISASFNCSVDDGDSPVQNAGQLTLEKKFILTGPTVTAKVNRANLPTRDSSLFTDMENTPLIRMRIPLNQKKSSLKMSQTFDSALETMERDCDYDEGIVSEHPDHVSACSNILKYNTKELVNPHCSAIKKILSDRKFVTEFNDFTPEKIGKMPSHRTEVKPKLSGRLSMITACQENVEYYIPCLILKPRLPTNKVILYFHGNGEDVNLARELLGHVRDQLNITVIAVEYPGYGLYKGLPSEEQVQVDAEAVYEYLTTKISVNPRNIILFGRSIGSGPATWLASRKNIGALVLMSAFTSIRAVVQHLVGKWAQYFIKERFNNLEHISNVTCPTFIVHGLKDKLIPYQHSQELYNKCKGLCELVLPKEMNHIEFDFHDDFTTPLIEFLKQISFGLAPNRNLRIEFPPELFQPPVELAAIQARYGTPRY